MMRKMALAMSAIVALGACQGMAQMPPEPGGEVDTCGATALQGLIGQPESVLQGMVFAGPLRVIRPGQAVTMDYSAARLNVSLDAGGRIVRVTCG